MSLHGAVVPSCGHVAAVAGVCFQWGPRSAAFEGPAAHLLGAVSTRSPGLYAPFRVKKEKQHILLPTYLR